MLWLTSFDETTDLLEFFFIVRKLCFKCFIVHRINFVNIEYKFVVVFLDSIHTWDHWLPDENIYVKSTSNLRDLRGCTFIHKVSTCIMFHVDEVHDGFT